MILTELAALADTPSFILSFEREMSTGKHQTKALCYAHLEQKRIKHIGAAKFKNYSSFRVARRIHLAKQEQAAQSTSNN